MEAKAGTRGSILVLRDDARAPGTFLVSGVHAIIERRLGGFTLIQLSATQPTYIMREGKEEEELLQCKLGQPLPERRVGHGDIVRFGGGPKGTEHFYERFAIALDVPEEARARAEEAAEEAAAARGGGDAVEADALEEGATCAAAQAARLPDQLGPHAAPAGAALLRPAHGAPIVLAAARRAKTQLGSAAYVVAALEHVLHAADARAVFAATLGNVLVLDGRVTRAWWLHS